jgi:hypothetical protein
MLNLAKLTLRGLLYLFFKLCEGLYVNLARLCEAYFAHSKSRRAYFARLAL